MSTCGALCAIYIHNVNIYIYLGGGYILVKFFVLVDIISWEEGGFIRPSVVYPADCTLSPKDMHVDNAWRLRFWGLREIRHKLVKESPKYREHQETALVFSQQDILKEVQSIFNLLMLTFGNCPYKLKETQDLHVCQFLQNICFSIAWLHENRSIVAIITLTHLTSVHYIYIYWTLSGVGLRGWRSTYNTLHTKCSQAGHHFTNSHFRESNPS